MINGTTNFDMNKFKDIETRYHRNLDEWLCNLYIEVKQFELQDFKVHSEKIEFKIPMDEADRDRRRKMEMKLGKSMWQIQKEEDEEMELHKRKEKGLKVKKVKDDLDSDSDDDEDRSDLLKKQSQDDNNIRYDDYNYATAPSKFEVEMDSLEGRDIRMRRIQYVTKEVIGDLGLTTTSTVLFLGTIALAFSVFWVRMVVHYLG
jgi:hypothetical protein